MRDMTLQKSSNVLLLYIWTTMNHMHIRHSYITYYNFHNIKSLYLFVIFMQFCLTILISVWKVKL